MRRQLGAYFKWEELFGYKLEEGAGNLDALRNGFDFDLGDLRGFALELVVSETTWSEDPRWFDGLLAIAVEHSWRQLALGHRFLTVLYVAETSALVGRNVEQITVPTPWRAPLGAQMPRVSSLRATFRDLGPRHWPHRTWAADRTGHRSSAMINRYPRAARTAAELNLGWLSPLTRPSRSSLEKSLNRPQLL